MFGTIRKHSKWLWLIIVTLTVLSFVYWGGNQGSGNASRGPANFGSISGQKVTEEAYFAAQREVYLNYYLNSGGEWPEGDAQRTGFDPVRETYFRLLLIQKQDEMGIRIGDEAVARVAAQIVRNFDKGGPNGMEAFNKTVLAGKGMSLGDLERCLRHTLAMPQLIGAVGLSGKLATPEEVRALYERENQELSAQAVFFNATNYLASVVVTPAALSEFYSNQVSRYRLPDRVQVGYVKFEATNFWAEAAADLARMTNQNLVVEVVQKYALPPTFAQFPSLADMVNAIQMQRGTNFYADMPADAVKASIRDELNQQCALSAARRQAAEFTDKLLALEPVKTANLDTLAQQLKLTAKVTLPFDRAGGPVDLDVSENFTKAAFSLRADEPFAGPVLSKTAAYVIAQHKEIPSEIPTFAAVEARVAGDYKNAMAVQAARTAAAAFAQSATNGLAQGKAFTSLCAEARATPVLLPPFSRATRNLPEVEDHITLQQFKQVAFGTAVGTTSPFIPTQNGGLVVYVRAKLPVDEKKQAENLPEFAKLVRQAKQNEAFQEWFNQEAQRALMDTPVMRPRQSELDANPVAK